MKDKAKKLLVKAALVTALAAPLITDIHSDTIQCPKPTDPKDTTSITAMAEDSKDKLNFETYEMFTANSLINPTMTSFNAATDSIDKLRLYSGISELLITNYQDLSIEAMDIIKNLGNLKKINMY